MRYNLRGLRLATMEVDLVVELHVADTAPDFQLPQSGGGTTRLSEFRGGKVVVYFYPKADTPSCTTESLDFTAQLHAFTAAGAVVIGISPDPVRKLERFATKHGLGVVLLSDEGLDTLKAYGVWGEKSMYGRSYMGVVRSTFLIDAEGRIARIWRDLKVKGHVNEVLEAVRQLG